MTDTIDRVDQIDNYDQTGDSFDLEPVDTNHGVRNLYRPSTLAQPVKQVPTDDFSVETFLVPDCTGSIAPSNIYKVSNRRAQGIAASIGIRIVAQEGAFGRVFIMRSEEAGVIVNDPSGLPYISTGHYLGLASSSNSITLSTTSDLYVVCLAAAAGYGALVSVCSEFYLSESGNA